MLDYSLRKVSTLKSVVETSSFPLHQQVESLADSPQVDAEAEAKADAIRGWSPGGRIYPV
jgi:hypothetical protein